MRPTIDQAGWHRYSAAMPNFLTTLDSLFALACLLPALFLGWVRPARPDGAFWASLALAAFGPGASSAFLILGGWHTSLASALWVSISATLLIYLGLCLSSAPARRLLGLLMSYLALLALIAAIWSQTPERPLIGSAPSGWLALHILVSVGTYALATLAAVAALAAFLQEQALKKKQPTKLTRQLPAMAESENMTFSLLLGGEAVLGVGVLSGFLLNVIERGQWLHLDHKTLLSLLAFLVIGALLAAHHRIGTRGRLATRLILLAYLLLTLAYPGVKFVTDVLMARPA
ncbi:MAG: cytochrome c biogenesis protein CcsA [Rhodospirillales bacterium]